MTDLPKLTLHEFQKMMNQINTINRITKPLPPSNRPWRKRCPCACLGCTDNSHCLKPPCTRTRNRRTQAEIDAAGRYVNGRVRDKPPSRPTREGLKMRTPEQIETTTGRYPSGRAKPDRSNWAQRSKYPRSKPQPQATPFDPLAVTVHWFVWARRSDITVTLPAPCGRDEAYGMAGHLFMAGWTVKVIGP